MNESVIRIYGISFEVQWQCQVAYTASFKVGKVRQVQGVWLLWINKEGIHLTEFRAVGSASVEFCFIDPKTKLPTGHWQLVRVPDNK